MTAFSRAGALSVGATVPGGERSEGSAEEAHSIRFGKREVLLNFAFWTFFGISMAVGTLLSPLGTNYPYPLELTGISLARSYLWAVLTPPIFWITSQLGLESGGPRPRILILLGGGVVAALLVTVVGALVESWVIPPPPRHPATGMERVWIITRFRFLHDLILYAAVVIAGIARNYAWRYQARREESVRLQAHAAQLQAQLAEARLAVLRSQLNPHFIFNTLNAVSGLVTKDPKGVRRMIARLSDLLRYALEGPREQLIPLGEELKLLQRYLEILEIRFQGRLETKIEVDPGLEMALVPNLILQPLAENAMKHGVSKAGGRGRIEVRARRSGDTLILSVFDTGPGDEQAGNAIPVPEEVGTGIGLRNTRARLAELYGERQSLELRASSEGGTVAEVAIPFQTRVESPDAGETART